MVDFTLSDEQKDIRELAHDFAEKEIRPVAWELDKDGTWPQDIIDKAWELGLMNSHIPEEYGGPGLDYLSGCLIEEEFGWGCSGIGTSRCERPRDRAGDLGGSEEPRRSSSACSPKGSSSPPCLTEPDAGSDVSGMRTNAVRKGDAYASTAEVLHHERRARRLLHRVRQDRQGSRPRASPRSWSRASRRRNGRQEGGQARPACLRHGDDLLQRRRGPGRQPDRRGEQRLQARDEDPRPPRPGVAAMARGCSGGLRVRTRLREGARAVRRADRDAPGDPVHDRRHGDQVEAARLLTWKSGGELDNGKRNS